MNSPLKTVNLPDAPPDYPTSPTIAPSFSNLVQQVVKLTKWARDFTLKGKGTLGDMTTQLNTQVQGIGQPLASANTITVSSAIHHVTGSAMINQINPAGNGFSGPIWLIADGGFTLGTGGNIALARGPFNVGQSVQLVYDPAIGSGTWYQTE
jgi:hypothetical protein